MHGEPAEPLACEVVIVTVDQAPILARPRLAQAAVGAWRQVDAAAIRACAALPDQMHAVIETADPARLNRAVAQYKALSEAALLDAIRRYYADDLLDAVTRYTPVWPGVVYRVWQDGYHCLALYTEASVTRKLIALRDRGILYADRGLQEGSLTHASGTTVNHRG